MNAESPHNQGGHDAPLSPTAAAEYAPPPSAPAPTASSPEPTRSSGARAGAIAIAVFGGIALLATGGTAAIAAVNDLSSSAIDSQQQVDASGITSVDLHLGGVDMQVEFGDVEEAQLDVSGSGSERWTLTRDGDELVVNSPDMNFGWWFGGSFDDERNVRLTLPDELRDAGLDADIYLGAGSLDVKGDFGDVDVEMGAGALFITGSARAINLDLGAGRAELELADVSEADFSLSAGRLEAELTGTAPDEVQFEVSAGSLDLTLPDEEYDVRREVTAGTLDNKLQTSVNARNSIVASVTAGSAVLRPGD